MLLDKNFAVNKSVREHVKIFREERRSRAHNIVRAFGHKEEGPYNNC